MKNSLTYTPLWVQNEIQSHLLSNEIVQTAIIVTNYPLELKKTYLAVTDKRLVGKEKTWFSSRVIDVSLRDITHIQIDLAIKRIKILKILCWMFLSLFLFFLIVPVVVLMISFLSIREKELIWTIRGSGNEKIEGKRHSLEVIYQAIRENQIAMG